MQIKVWSGFSKRINSTKQPTGGTTVDVLLKAETDIKNPSFILTSTDFTINYVMAFGNYYFCTPVNLDASRLELKCTMDYLATFKANVGAYSGLIEYTSASSDVTITDPRNKPTSLITMTSTAFTLSGINFNTTGGFIIGVMSDSPGGNSGVVDYYALTQAQMHTFCQNLYDISFWTQLQQFFTDAQQSLVSCLWIPASGWGGTDTPGPIRIGAYDVPNSNGARIVDRVVNFTSGATTINFSAASGGAGASMSYLEKPPYATGYLYLPFVGIVPLDMDIVAFTKNVSLEGSVDVLTGDIVYKIKYGAIPGNTYAGNIATKMPVTGASFDAVGVASGVLTAIGGVVATIGAIATGAGAAILAGGAGAAVAGAANAIKSTELHTMINGATSSALGSHLGVNPFAIVVQNEPSESNLLAFKNSHGMPYFEVSSVSSLSGFIKCADASVTIPGDGSEQDVVNGYMNSGFYYE